MNVDENKMKDKGDTCFVMFGIKLEANGVIEYIESVWCRWCKPRTQKRKGERETAAATEKKNNKQTKRVLI